MGSSRGLLGTALALGAVLALLPASGSPAAGPTVEAAGPGGSGYYWNPAHAEVSSGGSVTFKNSSASVPHGVTWTGGPETPACSGVPIDGEKTSWSGTCAFVQAGTYTFKCTVHPTEMTGSVTASSSATPPPDPTPSPGSPGSPAAGPVASGLKLPKNQRGGAVRGFLNLLQGGSGSSLEVELLAARASLGTGRTGKTRVGRLLRSSPASGHLSFSVPLQRLARRALRDRETLPLTVTVTATSPGGEVLKRSRGVAMLSSSSSGRENRR